jgi:recombination protein RecT
MGQVTNSIAVKEQAAAERVSPRATIASMLERNKGAITLSLPRGFDADRFSRLLLTAANTNPALFECEPTSFLAAGVAAAQLGLEPNDARGLAYLIPFNDRKRGKIVQLIVGYRGMMDLARRSGMVSSIHAFPVYDGDEFIYALGLDPTLHHVPADGDEDPRKMTHVYAVAKVNGDAQFVVLTRKQIDKTRNAIKGSDSVYSPWATHYTEMARKTAIRRLCKYLPQTVEVAQALAVEERALSLTDVGTITYDIPEPEPSEHDDAIDVNTETGEIIQPKEPAA